jgi:phthiocerol/phenolphthiocerol synthesis type-I polyketide synthase E
VLTAEQTGMVDDARRRLGVPLDDILLAALGRAVGATVGDGRIAVELGGQGRSVLRPDVDVGRTVGWFTTIYPVVIPCATPRQASARDLLDEISATLKAVPHYGIGYGLLRYVYAPTARLLGAVRPADIFFSHLGTIPDLPAGQSPDEPVRFDTDLALPVREAVPGLGHAVELRVYRFSGELHLDWWYDTRRLGHSDVESLSGQFSTALLDLAREALAEDETDSSDDELALVELS